jgi:hypothetical protein
MLLASPRSKSACESSVTGQTTGTICINAMPGIMLLASHRKVTLGYPTVLRVSTKCVGGYPTFAARIELSEDFEQKGPAEGWQNRQLELFTARLNRLQKDSP